MRLFAPPSPQQVIALAGVFQACELVNKQATTGIAPSADFACIIHSLFEQNPASTEAVFGGLDNLRSGLERLHQVLESPKDVKNATLLRYVLGVLYLQRKLMKNPKMLHRIGEGISKAATQAQHFNETHPNVVANLADLYQQTISTFSFRIQVQGSPEYLQQPAIAARIRCLLFAAIRAAVLWHQTGGRRHQFIFSRQQLLTRVEQLRRQLKP